MANETFTGMNAEPYRVALYWAPAVGSAGWKAGCQWLGADAASGEALHQPTVPGVEPALMRQITAEPRRYGWHATLKPPFRLRAGETLATLEAAVASLAQVLSGCPMPGLQVAMLDGFVALRLGKPLPRVDALAAACVKALHALAEPLSADELARRRKAQLTPQQDALLQAWGYPWVLEEFRFHCSLTSRLDGLNEAQRSAVLAAVQVHFSGLPEQRLDRLSVYVEPTKGAPFRLHRQWELRP
jgi:putative phosphonate metabolism protein